MEQRGAESVEIERDAASGKLDRLAKAGVG
jgi:hypothetical protein